MLDKLVQLTTHIFTRLALLVGMLAAFVWLGRQDFRPDALAQAFTTLAAFVVAEFKAQGGMTRADTVRLITRKNRPFDTLDQIKRSKNNVQLMGLVLNRVLSSNTHETLLEKVRGGCHFQFLALDPNSTLLESEFSARTELRSAFGTIDNLRRQIEYTLHCYSQLRGKGENEPELRLIKDFRLPFSLLITDRDEGRGLCRVELQLFNKRMVDRPDLYLYRRKHGAFFNLYCEQFDLLWEAAVPWTPPDPPAIQSEATRN